jgi:osmotically-inducible protein OsmY
VAEEIEVKLPHSVKHGNAEIAEAAVDRLAWNVSVPKDSVRVAVAKGWLTLTGQGHWHDQREEAANAVRSLWGVTGVSNGIKIKPNANAGNIKSDIMVALNRSRFTSQNINVTGDDGAVTLTGAVEYWDARALAGTTAWAAPGVTSVTNEVLVN